MLFDKERDRQAYLVITGANIDEETAMNIKKGIIKPSDCDFKVEWVTLGGEK